MFYFLGFRSLQKGIYALFVTNLTFRGDLKKNESTLLAIFMTFTIYVIKALILISITIPLNYSNEIELFNNLRNKSNIIANHGSNDININCENICNKNSTLNCDKMMISMEELFIWNNINWGILGVAIFQATTYFLILKRYISNA